MCCLNEYAREEEILLQYKTVLICVGLVTYILNVRFNHKLMLKPIAADLGYKNLL